MKITFIAHSAFLVEWDKFYTLFDYVYELDYTGTLPPLDPQKPLLVFSSHSHEDHFDGKVFGLLEQYPLTQFFVSRDTRLTERRRKWLGISDEAFARICQLPPADPPFCPVPPGNEHARWLEPRLVCTVQYLVKSESGSLRHAVFKALRPDKEPEDCRAE